MSTSFDFANHLNDVSTFVCKFFDELMVLYHLIGIRDDATISFNSDTQEVTFNIKMKTAADAKELVSDFNNTDFIIYGIKFNISMTSRRNVVYTSISKAIY